MTLARCVLVVALLAGCGEETETAPETVVEVRAVEPLEAVEPIAAPLPEPVHGGAMLAVGALAVEACVYESGIVDAYLAGARAPAAREVALRTTVSTARGPQAVALAWDPGEARFRGVVVEPVEGPLEVSATHAGEVRVGRLDRVAPIPSDTVASPRSPTRPRAPRAPEPAAAAATAPSITTPTNPATTTPTTTRATPGETPPSDAPATESERSGRRRVAPVQQNR